jgi:hypothetical protein
MNDLFQDLALQETRRHFFARGAHAVGWAALSSLLGTESVGERIRGRNRVYRVVPISPGKRNT